MKNGNENTVYLDNNATTRPYPDVLEAMKPFYNLNYGNPSSVHQLGRHARTSLDEARKAVADILNARSPAEVVFVSCATEANALAIRGSLEVSTRDKPHVVTTSIEHPSILKTLEWLEEKECATVDRLPVNQQGEVSVDRVRNAIQPETELVTVMMANNEVGTLQPVQEIAELCREEGIRFHTDAVQAPGKIPVDVQDPVVDMMSFSAHKFHGPPGIGIFYHRKETKVEPLLRGGGQEGGLRSGTESPPLAAGIAKALEIAARHQEETAEKTDRLRRRLLEGLRDTFGDSIHVNTPLENSLPNTLNVSFKGEEADKLLMKLDLEGVCVSAGSACHSGAIEISHVLEAMDLPLELAQSSVRFSLSRMNTEQEIDRTISVLQNQGS